MTKKPFLVISLFLSLCISSNYLFASAVGSKGSGFEGAVFSMTNAADGNEITMFFRRANGTLVHAASFPTGGLGSGGGLGNQGGLILTKNHRWLFAVNAGSDEISVFSVRPGKIILRDVVNSGGVRPVSLTFDRGLLYVLNAGDDSIHGFILSRRGTLQALTGSKRALSGTGTAPAQIQFNLTGELLVVTEKATNLIDTFSLDDHGIPSDVTSSPSEGTTPFGFAFDKRGRLFVSEAAGGETDSSSVSSYKVSDTGALAAISPSIVTTETAACWVAISGNSRFAYTTNTGSSSLSGYRIARNGSIRLLNEDGVTGETGPDSRPIDLAFSDNSRYLYALSASDGSINAFLVRTNGALKPIQRMTGLNVANGLAAY